MKTRVEFNRRAKQYRATDNLPALKKLAVDEVISRNRRGETVGAELRQTLALAATQAAVEWWEDGGNCHKIVKAAISAAARGYRGDGGYRADNTWRGGYNSDTRKYSSETHDHAAAVALHAATGDAPSEEPEPETDANGADAREMLADAQTEAKERTATRDREAAQEKRSVQTGEANIATDAAAVRAGAAERTDHDGGHADDARLNPRHDGETGYGVDGATCGLHTGRMVPSAYIIAWQLALEERAAADRHFLLAIDRAGGFDNYVNKNDSRKRARAAFEEQRRRLESALHRRTLELLQSAGDVELQAAWLAAQPKENGHRTVGARPGAYRGESVAPAPAGGTSSIRGGVLFDGGTYHVHSEAAQFLEEWRRDMAAAEKAALYGWHVGLLGIRWRLVDLGLTRHQPPSHTMEHARRVRAQKAWLRKARRMSAAGLFVRRVGPPQSLLDV